MPMAPGPGTTWTPPASPWRTCSSICLPARAAGPLMADRDKPPKIPAAGALVWRLGGQGREVVLVHRPRYDDWSFPKGKCLPGEHVLITAVREVAEETEIEIILGRKLRTVRYLSDGRPKQVDYWAARPAAQAADGADEPAEPAPFTPNEEVDELAWPPLPPAGDRSTLQPAPDLLPGVPAAPAAPPANG